MTAKIIIEIDLLAGPYEVSQQLLKLRDNIQRVNELLYGGDPMGAADSHSVNPFGRPLCEVHGIKEDLGCSRCREILGLEALKSSTGRSKHSHTKEYLKKKGEERAAAEQSQEEPLIIRTVNLHQDPLLELIRCAVCGDQGHATAQHVDEVKARTRCEHCGSEEHASNEHSAKPCFNGEPA